jgi:hypothetical protein
MPDGLENHGLTRHIGDAEQVQQSSFRVTIPHHDKVLGLYAFHVTSVEQGADG